MKAQLLIAGQARYAHPAKTALVERLGRIVELSTADVGLAAVTGRVKNHRVNVDPAAALSDQLNTNRSPISFHAVAPALQNPQRHRLIASVQRQVEVTVEPRLPTNQSIDTPTAGDPNRAAGLSQVCKDPEHLTKIHALTCSAGPQPASIAHHERHGVLSECQRSWAQCGQLDQEDGGVGGGEPATSAAFCFLASFVATVVLPDPRRPTSKIIVTTY